MTDDDNRKPGPEEGYSPPDDQSVPEEAEDLPSPEQLPELRIYSRSTLFYWWPVWLAGFVMAGLTYVYGETLTLGGEEHYLHPSRDLGIIYAAALFVVVLVTNVTMRGLASLAVVLAIMFLAVLLAWLDWWDDVLSVYPHLTLYATAGFYLIISSILFVAWALVFFVFDRLGYWVVRPGQLYHTQLIGESERTYDTRGMVVEKMSEDWFRHRLVGLGSGDIHVITAGARNEELTLPNVLRADKRIDQIHRLINVAPDDLLSQSDH
jgi:hypothetical protein